MAGEDSPKPQNTKSAENTPRKPLQVMHISRKKEEPLTIPKSDGIKENPLNPIGVSTNNYEAPPSKRTSEKKPSQEITKNEENISMEDLLSQEQSLPPNKYEKKEAQNQNAFEERIVDDFDFDEDAFLAALDQNEPIGNKGETATGKVINVDSDGVYVDIGGKAPGFMPKKECGLGVITNIKELFPKDLEVEVLVTREQNADGMVTISCRALALRKSWEKVQNLEKESKVVQVKVNGFNRGGVTCDLEGLRGFIPRSQLEEGENHDKLVGKTLGAAFLEVNPDSRKLVLSEKKAATVKRFSELEIGQLIEGKVLAIKPYGYFIDLGGVSGLLHQSAVTNGSLRSLSEVFKKGEQLKALITDIDPRRGRIGLNTALLEGPPGEIIQEKEKVMAEAKERSIKAIDLIKNKEVSSSK
tara:strand:- start:928 stop:2169 length:1242 start_codon:yes stop_codon:yes gene_type:complete